MPVNFPNFLNAPLIQPDYSGFEKLIPNFLQGYYEPKERSQKLEKGKHEMESTKLHNALLKKYGEKEAESKLLLQAAQAKAYASGDMETLAKIALMQAQTKNIPLGNVSQNARDIASVYGFQSPEYNERVQEDIDINQEAQEQKIGGLGRGGMTPQQRALNNLPADERRLMSAQMRAWGKNPDAGFYELGYENKNMEQIKAEQKEKGFDVDNAPIIYAPTSSSITAQQKRIVTSAGANVIDHFVGDATAPYSKKFLDYSPAQIWDSLRGGNEDKLVDFYAARILEEENTIMNVVKSGGQVNMHAVDRMLDKSMGNTKVIPFQMNEERAKKIRKRAREVIDKAMEAEQKAFSGQKENREVKKDLLNEGGKGGTVTIKNNRTGEIQTISREEYEKLKSKGSIHE